MNRKTSQPTQRFTTIYSRDHSAAGIEIPSIRVRGLWLHNAGFQNGEILEIEVREDCLILRKTNKRWKQKLIVERTMVDCTENR